MMYWHAHSVEQVEKEFHTHRKNGLSEEKAEKRLEECGENILKAPEKKSLFTFILEQGSVFFVFAVAALFLQQYWAAALIFIIDLLYVGFGILQKKRAQTVLENVQKQAMPYVKVRRGGESKFLAASSLVPGDVVLLKTGDVIPADVRLTACIDFKVDESALTGDATPILKDVLQIEKEDTQLAGRNNMVYASGKVVDGRATGIVCATGMDTQVGQMAEMVAPSGNEDTPSEIRLARVMRILPLCVLGICAIVFVVGVLWTHLPLDFFLVAASLAVVAIPKGLPIVSSLAVTNGLSRMAQKNIFLKKLHAVEPLGQVSVLCVDAEGLFQKDKMAVSELYAGGTISPSDQAHQGLARSILAFASLGTGNAFEGAEDSGKEGCTSTDQAVALAAQKVGLDGQRLRESMPCCAAIAWDSKRKLRTTIHSQDGRYLLITVGAPEGLVGLCTDCQIGDGLEELDEARAQEIRAANEEMAAKGLRVQAVAVKYLDVLPAELLPEAVENELIFIGLIGMTAPIEGKAEELVRQCRLAGIRPVIVTGASLEAALSMAGSIGISNRPSDAIDGKSLSKMNDDELIYHVRQCSVFCEITPELQAVLVKGLQKAGETVSFAGIGVDDVSSLEAADIGYAMGVSGVGVTFRAADLVLADDDIMCSVTAVQEGRRIHQNIRRAWEFLLGANLSKIIAILIATLCNWATPLLPLQLLWAGLVTDFFPTAALGLEPTATEAQPRKDTAAQTKAFCVRVALQGLLIGGLALLAFWLGSGIAKEHSVELGRTMAFCVLVLAQLFYALGLRSRKSVFQMNPTGNWFLLCAVLIGAVLQVLVVQIPFLSNLFGLVPLSASQWLWMFGLSLIPILASECYKLVSGRINKKGLGKQDGAK